MTVTKLETEMAEDDRLDREFAAIRALVRAEGFPWGPFVAAFAREMVEKGATKEDFEAVLCPIQFSLLRKSIQARIDERVRLLQEVAS